MSVVSLRRAAVTDVPAIRSISDATEPPPDAAAGGFPEALDAYYRHLIERGETIIAESDGFPVGFGATIDSGRGVHLADLFVLPDRQGGGIGKQLLEACFGDRWPRTTFSSDDPRALPLYVRMGMRPLWPNLYLAGDGRQLPEAPSSVVVEAVRWEEVTRLEASWWGIERPVEHEYWAGQPANVPFVVRVEGRPVAAGHARSRLRGGGRWMNQLFVRPGETALEPTLAAMRWSADASGRIGTCVLGPHPAVPALIAAGFRVVDRDTFQASDPAIVDAERLVVNTGIL